MSDRWQGKIRVVKVTRGSGLVSYVVERRVNELWQPVHEAPWLDSATEIAQKMFDEYIISEEVIIT